MVKITLQYILNHKRISVAIVLIIGLGWVAYYFNSIQAPQTTVVIDPKKTFTDLVPGATTHDEIIRALGVPERIYDEGGYTVYTYPSTTSYYMPDLLYVKNERLLMKELHYSPRQFVFTKGKLVQQYGSPDKTFYMPGNNYLDYQVYIYEKSGIAAYIDGAGNVFKLRSFRPMSADDYVSTWDKVLTTIKPTPQLEKHE